MVRFGYTGAWSIKWETALLYSTLRGSLSLLDSASQYLTTSATEPGPGRVFSTSCSPGGENCRLLLLGRPHLNERTVTPVSRAMEALFKLGPGHACWPLKMCGFVFCIRDYSRWFFFLNQFKFLLHFSVCVTVSTMSWGLAWWQAPLPMGASHLIHRYDF